MVDDKLATEVLKLLDRIRKRYGKSMQEKDKKDLTDLNKRLYDEVGGIVKDPLQRIHPLAKPLSPGSGNYQVAPSRQAEAVDLHRLAEMTIKKMLE